MLYFSGVLALKNHKIDSIETITIENPKKKQILLATVPNFSI